MEAQPTSTGAASFAWSAYNNLAEFYSMSGHKDKGVAIYRRAREALDRLSMEKFDTPVLRVQWAYYYSVAVGNLAGMYEFDGLAALCRRVIAAMEPIYRAEPGNERYRTVLVSAYDKAQPVFLNSGQIARLWPAQGTRIVDAKKSKYYGSPPGCAMLTGALARIAASRRASVASYLRYCRRLLRRAFRAIIASGQASGFARLVPRRFLFHPPAAQSAGPHTGG